MYIRLGILAIFLLYLWFICPNLLRRKQMLPFLQQNIAHRGFHNVKALTPENSMSSFQKAVDHHLAIEIDIHLTKDNQVVVFHDYSLKRVCGEDIIIEDATYEELSRYTLSGTNERIPLLTDVLSLVDGKVPLLIELKIPGRSLSLCESAASILDHYQGAYLIQSFHPFGLRWFWKKRPQVLRGQLSSNLTKDPDPTPYIFRLFVRFLLTNILCRPDFISYKLRDRHNISLILNQHFYHIPIAVWTIRDPDSYRIAKKNYDMVIFEELSIKFINIL